jgi:hypothetical protein
MKTPNPQDDARLSGLIRASREAQPLPPRFQESVWRRIERGEAPASVPAESNWLDAFAALLLRPRFALACVSVLLLAGVLLGTVKGATATKLEAQARYFASVSPETQR